MTEVISAKSRGDYPITSMGWDVHLTCGCVVWRKRFCFNWKRIAHACPREAADG